MQIPASYYAYMNQREGSTKNPLSSAYGPGQFLNGTWATLMKQHPELGLTANGRSDPSQTDAAIRAFTSDNAGVLSSAGFDDPKNLYLAHRFGAQGALNLLKADPNADASTVLSPAILKANPDLNGSIGNVIARNQFAGGATPGGSPFTTSGGMPLSPQGTNDAQAQGSPQDLAAAKALVGPGAASNDPFGGVGNGLLNAGAALMSVYNPAGASALTGLARNSMLSQTLNKAQFGVIGEDVLGNKQYGFIDPLKRTVTPVNGSGAAGSGLNGDLTSFGSMLQGGEKDPNKLLAALPSAVQGEIKGMLEGKASGSALGRGTARAKLIAIAHAIDPSFDETTYAQRQTVARGFGSTTPNSYGGQKASAQTILNHADEFLTLIPKLQNGELMSQYGPDFLRRGSQAYRKMSGDKEFQNNYARASQLAEGIAGETSKLLTGGQGSETTRNEYRQKLDLAQTPSAIYGAMRSVADVMQGRLQSMADQYNAAYGTNKQPTDFLEPKYKAIYQKIIAASDQSVQPSVPQVTVHPMRGGVDAAPMAAPQGAATAAPYPGARGRIIGITPAQ